jgi:hypothetical protein
MYKDRLSNFEMKTCFVLQVGPLPQHSAAQHSTFFDLRSISPQSLFHLHLQHPSFVALYTPRRSFRKNLPKSRKILSAHSFTSTIPPSLIPPKGPFPSPASTKHLHISSDTQSLSHWQAPHHTPTSLIQALPTAQHLPIQSFRPYYPHDPIPFTRHLNPTSPCYAPPCGNPICPPHSLPYIPPSPRHSGLLPRSSSRHLLGWKPRIVLLRCRALQHLRLQL